MTDDEKRKAWRIFGGTSLRPIEFRIKHNRPVINRLVPDK